MKKKLFKGFAVAAALALSAGVVTPAHAANEIVVWADETRGPNIRDALATKSSWVSGYTVTVKAFANFDALKEAIDKATATTGPDIVVGANDWVPTLAKNGKLAPLTLTASQRARFSSSQFYDLSYKKKLYGIPVDVNNVAMIYNTKLVTTAPKTFGDMVDYYKANKASKNLKAGLCVAGGGMSWGAHSVFSALGADAYYFNSDGRINKSKTFSPTSFGANVRKFLMDGGKSNGFFPASDAGCKDNYLDGTVPFAIIGNWEWNDYKAKGFEMNLMPVPGVTANNPGKAFGSVSGALLTSFASTRGVEAAAKSLLVDFFGSTAGQVAYQKIEKRPPAEKGASTDASVTDGQKGFGASAAAASIPQVGAILNGPSGTSYWDSAPAFWTAVLVDGKNPVREAKKLRTIWSSNLKEAYGEL
ncbi:MAG: sugar ABC transporter substrate-binding protein [Candidatus Nanopelagicaceae bacterium]|jgi:arabinogalactan oligomer/maltooligosaccharide transport system substrate-binding protein